MIVVGNLVAGGSGKTPVVAALARHLDAAGFRVAIITRGYGGSAGSRPVRVESGSTAGTVGDEALELSRATGLPVWACSRRRRALEAATADGAEVVLSDDGLQHAALPRSYEICVVDGRRGFGNRHLLPAGPLRQPTRRLDSVDLVLLKRPVHDDPAPGLPAGVFFALESGELDPLGPDGRSAVPTPATSVDAVAGIADPEGFFRDLEADGFTLRRHPLADHQPIDPGWLSGLRGPVVLTAKDAVRLPGSIREDIFVRPVRARIPDAVTQRVAAHVREFRR